MVWNITEPVDAARFVFRIGRETSRRHFLQQRKDFAFECFDVRLDFFQRARRLVAIEVTIERNLVADLGFALVDPGIGNVRQHFALEVIVDVFLQRHVLGVAQFGIGFGLAV